MTQRVVRALRAKAVMRVGTMQRTMMAQTPRSQVTTLLLVLAARPRQKRRQVAPRLVAARRAQC